VNTSPQETVCRERSITRCSECWSSCRSLLLEGRSSGERSRTGTVLGSRVSVCKPEQEQALAEQHRLGELCPRISRTGHCSNQREPNSRPGFGTGRRARAEFCAALSREIGNPAKVGQRSRDGEFEIRVSGRWHSVSGSIEPVRRITGRFIQTVRLAAGSDRKDRVPVMVEPRHLSLACSLGRAPWLVTYLRTSRPWERVSICSLRPSTFYL
jgi:hypothetical protein